VPRFRWRRRCWGACRWAWSFAIVLLVRDSAGSYALAGVVSAAYSVGLGLVAPLLGRLTDRSGQTRVLVPCALGYCALLAGLVAAAGSAPVVALVAIAAAAGALFPPLSACMRVLWPLIGVADPRESAFALYAIVVGLAYVIGPLLITAIVAVAGPSSAVAFGVLDVGLPAFAESVRAPDSAGLLFASLATGNLVAGVAYGARSWRGPVGRRYLRLLLVFAAGLALLPLASSVPTMLVVAFIAGGGLAPGAICALRLIDQLTPPGTATEAYTWTTSANVAGTALGAVLAGAAVDALDVRIALSLACLAVCGGAAVVALRSSTLRPASAGVLR